MEAKEGGKLLFYSSTYDTLYLLGENLSLCPQFQHYCNIYRRQHTIQAFQWVLKVNVLLVGVCGCM